MKILHYNLGLPPYRTGGLTKYSVDLITNQRSMGHELFLLYPGAFKVRSSVNIKANKLYDDVEVYEIINPLPIPLLNGIKNPSLFMKSIKKNPYFDFLNSLKPEIIHVHTLMGLHIEFLEAAKLLNIKLVFTPHDYFGICPKVNLVKSNGEMCDDYQDGFRCIECNKHGFDFLSIMIMQSRTYRVFKDSKLIKDLRMRKKSSYNNFEAVDQIEDEEIEKEGVDSRYYKELREYYLNMIELFDKIHFNSSITKNEFEKYVNKSGQVISITHKEISDSRKSKEITNVKKPLQIGYIGPLEKYKGYEFLVDALESLRSNGELNWHLSLFGDDRGDLNYDSDFYSYNGKYNYKDLGEIFNNIDVLIIPSMWKETFGLIGLEAISHGVPVMLSEFVGFKDLIRNYKNGIIFKGDKEDFSKKLIELIHDRSILKKININILDMEIDLDMGKHTEDILTFYCAKETKH